MPNLEKRRRKGIAAERRESRRRLINKGKLVVKPKPVDSYLERWRVLQALGFKSYGDYLAGDLWKSIRVRGLHGSEDLFSMRG